MAKQRATHARNTRKPIIFKKRTNQLLLRNFKTPNENLCAFVTTALLRGAVKAAGVTSIGVRGKYSVYVVTPKKAPDMLLDSTSVPHLFLDTKFLGLLATGTTDCCLLLGLDLALP